MPYSPMQIAEAFVRTGELADALDVLNPHLDQHPDDDEARRLRAAILRRTGGEGDLQTALDDLNALKAPTTDDEVERSILLQGMEDWAGANAAMEKAHTLRPDDERITERYLLTLEKSGQAEQAQALLDRLPKSWRWLQSAGDLAQRQGNRTRAAELYTAALADLMAKMDTDHNAFAANLRQVLILKHETVTGGA